MTDELKPCKCGGRGLYKSQRCAEDAMEAFVICKKCGYETERFEDAYAPRADAIAAWNERPRNDME